MRIFVAAPSHFGDGHSGATWAIHQYSLGLALMGHKVLVGGPQDLSGQEFDLVLNTSGTLDPETMTRIPLRVYLDLDPAFNQLWHEEGIDRRFEGHTHFVTVGQAIGTNGCDIPTHGLKWIGTLPPVVLESWPEAGGISTDAFTTVANFRSYGSVNRNGLIYGQKVHSLRALLDLPRRTRQRFMLAMLVHPDEKDDLAALVESGWEFTDPHVVAGTPDAYRDFVRGSLAEIGIVKSGYVLSRCGWFSDRSACYLASGRPVIMQETGFSSFVPSGEGLLAFKDVEGAASAVESVRSEYQRHARAARKLAQEHFDAKRVLGRLLEQVTA